MMVALLGNARWMEEVNSIQMDGGSEVHSELSQRERERFPLSLRGHTEIPGPSALILLPPTFNVCMCCAQYGQDCIHMFTLGSATLRTMLIYIKYFMN